MIAAIADTVAAISGRYTVSSLNAIVLAPGALYAISCHDRPAAPAAAARGRGYQDRPARIAACSGLAYRASGDAVLVASSGWPVPGWKPLPPGHVLVTLRRTLATAVAPLPLS
jgi:hypothetical protein